MKKIPFYVLPLLSFLLVTRVLFSRDADPTPPADPILVNDSRDQGDMDLSDAACDAFPAEGNQCTLRAAIDNANKDVNDDRIILNFTEPTTILMNAPFVPLHTVTIEGPMRVSLNAQGTGRVFAVRGGALLGGESLHVTLRNLTLLAGTDVAEGGALVASDNAIVAIENCTIENNRSRLGGGLSVVNGAQLSLTQSIVRQNRSNESGGGIFTTGGSAVTIEKSLIQDNVAESDTFGFGGGIYAMGSILHLDQVSVHHNTAAFGGGLALYSSTTAPTQLRSDSSTISENIARQLGGGVYEVQRVGEQTVESFFLSNTIISNQANGSVSANAGGVLKLSGLASFVRTILTDNHVGTTLLNCYGTYSSLGDNLEDSSSCIAANPSLNDRIDLTMHLGEREARFGSYPVLQDSPAFNGVRDLYTGARPGGTAFDQRGVARPLPVNVTHEDIGAYEVACGDNVVQTFNSEQCDDGNIANGDGCNATCQTESGAGGGSGGAGGDMGGLGGGIGGMLGTGGTVSGGAGSSGTGGTPIDPGLIPGGDEAGSCSLMLSK